jgi:serine protease Do
VIGGIQPGKTVDVSIWRDGKADSVKVDLGTLPGSDKQAAVEEPAPADANALEDLGLTVTRADDGKGVVVTDVDPDSAAADRDIQPGDVITSVNSRAVASADDVTAAVADASKAGRKAVLMQIQRGEDSRFVAVPVAKG